MRHTTAWCEEIQSVYNLHDLRSGSAYTYMWTLWTVVVFVGRLTGVYSLRTPPFNVDASLREGGQMRPLYSLEIALNYIYSAPDKHRVVFVSTLDRIEP